MNKIKIVLEKEKPDSLLAGMGGQTGLNLAVELHDAGILDKYGVKRIGTSVNLYVDQNGDVIGESTDVGFFFLGGFISFVFYIVFLFTFLSDIF